MNYKAQQDFLSLVRLGLGHHGDVLSGSVDWQVIQALAERQGLSAIIVDGVEKLADSQRPPKDVLLQWIGEVLQNYEQRFVLYRKAIAELAGFYNSRGYKMMVLKGYACGLNWPKPEHRPYGDIDIWQFGQQKQADEALAEWFKSSRAQGVQEFKIDNSHHHHSVFNYGEFMVENHYDFINVYHHLSNRGLEKMFKELGQDDSHFIEVNGEKVYLPSSNLQALFLLKHSMNDFTSFSVNVRQLLDWAFFVEKNGKYIDWDWLVEVLKKYYMMDFFNTINAICVDDLGFDVSLFHNVQFKPDLKEKVLKNILEPEFTANEPSRIMPRLVYKYKRWRGNAWKHKMCYHESMWSAFWSGVWSHLLKPSSI